MTEPFVWGKFFDFSWTTITKILSLVFKIMMIVGVPALVLWGAYILLIKPHTNPTPTQSGQITNNYYYPSKTTFSLVNVFGWELLSKHSFPEKPTITETKVTK